MKKPSSSSVIALGLALAALWPDITAAQVSVIPSQGVGAKMQNGTVALADFPTLILYWIQVLLQLAGAFAVVMIMVGGCQYMIGSVSNDKEQGKKTITYAIGGLILAFFAWWIVELIQVWLTT